MLPAYVVGTKKEAMQDRDICYCIRVQVFL